MSNYQFLKYFTENKKNSLENINIIGVDKSEVMKLQSVVEGTFVARDLVNEPLSYLTALQYSKDIEALGRVAGFEVEVYHARIETQKWADY